MSAAPNGLPPLLEPQQNPYTRLPFVCDPPKEGEGLIFWHVRPNGNYSQECNLGDEFARELLSLMRDRNDYLVARWVILGMVERNGGSVSGIEVGFLGTICRALLHGLTTSEGPKMEPPFMMWERQHKAKLAAERAAKRAARAAAKLAAKTNGAGDNQAGRG